MTSDTPSPSTSPTVSAPQGATPALRAQTPPSFGINTRKALLTVLGALLAGILLTLGLFYRTSSEDAKQKAYLQLEAVLAAKETQINAWRTEQIDDSLILQDRSLIEGPLLQVAAGEGTEAEKKQAKETLLRMASTRGYKSLLLCGPDGKIHASKGAAPTTLHEHIRRRLSSVSQGLVPELIEMALDPDGDAITEVIIPIYTQANKISGFLIAGIPLRNTLRSLISPWPTASATSEAYVIFSRPEQMRLLSPRRFIETDSMDMGAPPLDDPLSRFASSSFRLERYEGLDYRSKKVLAVAKPIDDSAWLLIAKTDEDEVLADVRKQSLTLTLASLILLGFASLAVSQLWSMQTRRDREALRAEIQRRTELDEVQQRMLDAQRFGRLGSWERNLLTGENWWSDGMYELIGINPDDTGLDNQPPALLKFVHAADRDRFTQATKEQMKAGERGEVIVRVVTRNGDIRHVQHQWHTQINDQGEPWLRRGVTQDITDRVKAEISLREQLDMMRTLVDNVPGGVTLFDADLRLRTHNLQYQMLMDFPDDLFRRGATPYEEFVRYNAWRGEFGPGDPEQQTTEALEQARNPKKTVVERIRPDGSAIEIRTAPIKGGGFVAIYTDITERKRAEQQLRLSAKIIESSPTAILITNARNQVISVNPAFTAITGFELRDVRGKNPRALASGRHDASFYKAMWEYIEQTDHWAGEIWDRRKDGSTYPKWLSIHVLRDANNRLTNYVGMFTDITERKQAEQRIEHLAQHDPLTGLANRMALESRLEQALAEARRNERQLALMFIDLDRFKMINDSLGHQVGDLLLMEIAGRLAERLRESDIVARLGGDEFVVVLTDLQDSTHAALVADGLLKAIAKPINSPGHELHTSGSIGIAMYPTDGETADMLMQNADTAMYESKAAGRNQMRFFTQEMSTTANDRLQLENSLRSALIERQFLLHYQPQVEPATGRIVGVEALVRWMHPVLGMIGPDRFIPIAEETGLIVEIGEYVLREGCRQGRLWHDAGWPIRMSINLSARQLRSTTLTDLISTVLQKSGLPADALELEITESALMEHPQQAVEILRQIRALGISLALDDFGTGYSSLAYLKMFPLDRLKIDRSFVRDIETDPDDRAIALSTIALAHSLGLTVVAEGVEEAVQVEFLRTHGCEEAQGWYYCKALPPEQLEEKLARGVLP